MTYQVQTAAYCGMVLPHGDYEDYEEALARVHDRIRYLTDRQDCEVVQLDASNWEVLEPEGCVMVPDFCGVMSINHIPDVDNESNDDWEPEDDEVPF